MYCLISNGPRRSEWPWPCCWAHAGSSQSSVRNTTRMCFDKRVLRQMACRRALVLTSNLSMPSFLVPFIVGVARHCGRKHNGIRGFVALVAGRMVDLLRHQEQAVSRPQHDNFTFVGAYVFQGHLKLPLPHPNGHLMLLVVMHSCRRAGLNLIRIDMGDRCADRLFDGFQIEHLLPTPRRSGIFSDLVFEPSCKTHRPATGYLIFDPRGTSSMVVRRAVTSWSPAASTMPWDSTPISFAGFKLATMTMRFPSISSGVYFVPMPATIWRCSAPMST